jgi:hypothetical protein
LLQNITGNSEENQEGLESREMGLFVIYVAVFNLLGRKVNTIKKCMQEALTAVTEINIFELVVNNTILLKLILKKDMTKWKAKIWKTIICNGGLNLTRY